MNIEIKDKQILIDGKPQLIMSGEIHYYRLERNEWEDRIIKLKEAGCNTVATYIPWICHEPIEGEIDVEGKTRDILDIGAFIDLCKKHGLFCFMRPGPFVMAEMKNEGIPHWVVKKYPELVPITWDGNIGPNPTLDYLNPNFLKEVKKPFKKDARDKAIVIAEKLEGAYPDKAIDLMERISEYFGKNVEKITPIQDFSQIGA